MTGTISAVIHGHPGVGKSTFADSTPGPRLVLDAEITGSKYTPSDKVYWDPLQGPAPDPPSDDGSVVVPVTEWPQAEACLDYLYQDHPFNSVVVDSITEIQSALKHRLMENSGLDTMRIQDWGDLLHRMEVFCKRLRNQVVETARPRPINVCILALCDEATDPMKPIIQGKAARYLPGWYDLFGYMDILEHESVTYRRLTVIPNQIAQAKCRIPQIVEATGGTLTNPVWDNLTEHI